MADEKGEDVREIEISSDSKTGLAPEQTVLGTVRLFDANNHIRKIPIPSDNPNDPLNWSPAKRWMVQGCLSLYGSCAFGLISTTALFIPQLVGEYEAASHGTFDASHIGWLMSYVSLCMGLGNFLFVPMSMTVGRRPMFLLNNILLIISCIWAATSRSFLSHLGARCLQGLSSGICDCLLPIIVLDITFLHRRGVWLSVYWSVTSIGSNVIMTLIPLVIQSANNNWRVAYWFWVAFSGASLIAAFFFLPETLFPREPAMVEGKVMVTDGFGQMRVFEDLDTAAAAGYHLDQHQPADVPKEKLSFWQELFYHTKVTKRSFRNFGRSYLEMAACLTIPGVFWALALNIVLFGGIVAFSFSYAGLLEAPPYNFSAVAVGTTALASALGALISLIVTSPFIEWLASILTKRNNGIREPEFLLPTMIIPVLMTFVGIALYGVVGGNPESYSWVGIYAALALFQFGFVSVSAISGVWLGEIASNWAGPAVVLVNGGRNSASFGITHGFSDWLTLQGFRNTYITFASIFLGISLFGIPLYFGNKYMRRVYSGWLSRILA